MWNQNTVSWTTGLAIAAVLFVLAPAAQSSVIGTHNNRGDWESMTPVRTNIDFESLGLGVGGFTNYSTAAGLTIGGVTFTGWEGNHYYLYGKNPPLGSAEDFNSSTLLLGPQYWEGACCPDGSYLLAVVPGGTTSFGIDLMSAYPAGAAFQFYLDGIDVGVVVNTQANPTRTFFGVRTDSAFMEVKIRIVSGTLFTTQGLFDNVSYGLAGGVGGETPELTTVLYVATGLFMLRWGRRRRGSKAAPAAAQ